MTDTDPLAALLHERRVGCTPDPTSEYHTRVHYANAARLIAAGVRFDATCECGHPDLCTPLPAGVTLAPAEGPYVLGPDRSMDSIHDGKVHSALAGGFAQPAAPAEGLVYTCDPTCSCGCHDTFGQPARFERATGGPMSSTPPVAGETGCDYIVPAAPAEGLREAILYGPEGVTFPNLPHHPTGPDVLDAVAAWMDKVDDRDPNPYVSRSVQRHLRAWADRLRAALAREYAKEPK
ncbi:MAG TPA: hypothetical protein VMW94_05215 [Actinomycetes bacterium]|nr:hypothetical protein [Actinomycetes bacterium]